MGMKKNILVSSIIIVLFLISGCSHYLKPQAAQASTDIDYNNNTDKNKEDIPAKVRPRSLGGICLGDSSQDVINILGKEYKESLETDIAGYMGEDMVIWNFDRGIVVTLGKESGKVLKVISHSKDFETDQGIKAGDNAKFAVEKYSSQFEGVKSRHSNETLTGWFHIGDEQIIIFDFDKEDGTSINNTMDSSSNIQEIVLAYWKHFD